MNQQLDANNYIVVDNFINAELANQLYHTFLSDVQNNPQDFVFDNQCPSSFAVYNYPQFLNILCDKISFMNHIMNEPMLPTYCYARMYQHGEVLKKHLDRPSCEISVTAHLGGDHSWDFYITKPNGKQVSIDLKPGQGVIYKGMIAEHWRNTFDGTNYGQIFLHYVRGNGEHYRCYGDRIT